MIAEHERVILLVDMPQHHVQAGDVGVVVHIYHDQTAYEIEFFTLDGHTLDVVTIEATRVRPVSHRNVLHVRERTV